MQFIAVIPSRLASTRLPSKSLIDIAGKSLIQRVYEGIKDSEKLSDIYIATDSNKILEHCNNFGANCIMTPSEMPSGTDRIWYAIKKENIEADVILNIQGDEPFVNPKLIDDFCNYLENHHDFQVGTIIKEISNLEDLISPSVVKVVINKNNQALYFSRNPIPFVRDYPFERWLNIGTFYKHIGIYAYKYEILERFISLPQSNLEKLEKLEQLRLLEDGIGYLCYETNQNLVSIDTETDLAEARKRFSEMTD
ncbi:MAG: 3-deoxy-manno-octulosonate cytidylyltransferase [Candidatus Kapabacteria bacterium]|jgi:3-deoxy-manno-octulosonate cytidylyltransferase (CMP-KDO synthetase)|nr:3-deoxy-manno-octulosonate cytidylyltransferase [Candidatus Kapabacteria bacterium]